MEIRELKIDLVDTCTQCGGEGWIDGDICPVCWNTGLTEDTKGINLTILTIGNTAFINTTPHTINGVFNGEEIEIPSSGFLLNAYPEEKAIKENEGIEFVKTIFNPSLQGKLFLNNIRNNATIQLDWGIKNLIIIGSIIAVNAYPWVCGLTPMPGFERVAPALKKMNLNKFTMVEE